MSRIEVRRRSNALWPSSKRDSGFWSWLTKISRSLGLIVMGWTLAEVTAMAQSPANALSAPRNQESSVPALLPPVTVYGTNLYRGLELDTPGSTGSRLGISARDLPLSVSNIDRNAMDQLGARTLLEAAQLAPGLTTAEPPSTPGYFSSRGFTGNDVVMLYDGLSFGPPSMVGHPEDMWKYARVEVLKGPSSLLYGEGALAGAVNYVPRSPNPERFEHEVFASYGSFNTSRLGLDSSGPLGTNGLSYRFDVSRQSSDGYVEETGHEYYDVSGALRYDPSDRLTLTFSFDSLWEDFGSYWGTPLINGQIDSRTREINYNVADDITEVRSHWLRLQASWRPSENVELRNIAYGFMADRHWQNVERYTHLPSSNLVRRTSPVEIMHDQNLIGDRLDLVFKQDLLGHENRFLTGLEFWTDDFQRDSNRPDSGFDYVDPFSPVRSTFENVRTAETTPERRTRTVDGALFLEDQFRVFDRFSLLGGVRGEVIDLNSENLRPNVARREFNRTFTPVTGRIGGIFEVVTNLSLYATYGTAAKAPNVLVVLDDTYRDFDLEQGEMVEVGVKQSLWDNRLDWTLALYQIWTEDIVTRDPVDPTLNQQIGKQSSQGIELALALRPVKEWKLGGNVAVLDAEYDRFNVASGRTVVSYSDNTPPNVPQVVANAWTSYLLPGGLQIGAMARYVGEVQANNANTLQLPDYATLDLFATYWFKRVEFGLRARNVLDKEYALWSVGDGAQALLGAPLSIEGSIRVRF